MNFTIEKSTLENMLSSLQAFLEKKDNAEITSHILIKIENQKLILNATDYELGLLIETSNVNILEDGNATCNGKKFLDIVRTLKDNQVDISFKNNQIEIKQNRSNYKLPSFDPNEFPSMPNQKDLPKIDIESSKLIMGFKKVNPVIATNNPKHELNGALLDIKNNVINIVSTDSKRLAIFKIDSKSIKTLSLIIPKKAIQEIQKLFSTNIEIFFDNTNLIIKANEYLFFTKVINGKFPDFERIIPKELKHNFTLPKQKMIESIKQVNIISNEIKITFKENLIQFESVSNENMEASTILEYSHTIYEPFSIVINSRYMIDFLANVDSDEFLISFNEETTPFQVKTDNFSSIMMPISI